MTEATLSTHTQTHTDTHTWKTSEIPEKPYSVEHEGRVDFMLVNSLRI